MTYSYKLLRRILPTLYLSTLAVAQTRTCIGGDLDHLSEAQRNECRAKSQVLRTAADALHAPENWHYVVVCGEQGWQDYIAYAQVNSLEDASANTDLDEHETFFRERDLPLNDTAALRHVIAHEIATIQTHSKGNLVVQSKASYLEKSADQAHVGL